MAWLTARPWPVHPILIAAYFVLFLYSVNLDEAELADVLQVLMVVVGLTAGALIVGGIVLRDIRRAAILLSALVVPFLGYGHVSRLLAPVHVGTGVQQVGWAVLVGLAVVFIWRAGRWIPQLTRILNVGAVALILVPLVAIVPNQLGRIAAAQEPATAGSVTPGATTTRQPDIYWFIFDRYPSERSARLAYGIENPIFAELRRRGFYVADRSHANYQHTTLSLKSTFSAEFLDGRGHADIFGPTDQSDVYSRIQNSNIARFLKAQGYYYVHVGSDFSPTRTSTLADVNQVLDNSSDFGTAFIDSTALPAVARRIAVIASPHQRRYDWTTWELDHLEHLPRYPSPTFLFGHVLLPHTPYIFDPEGRLVTEAANRGRSHKEQFAEQLEFTNKRLLAILDHLLDVPVAERPLIIVQADEGPYPPDLEDETEHDWTLATPEEREIKFGIMNAWYIPDGRDIGLYPEITPVNTFRLLFNAYFDTELPLLPDESYSLSHPEPLTFPPP